MIKFMNKNKLLKFLNQSELNLILKIIPEEVSNINAEVYVINKRRKTLQYKKWFSSGNKNNPIDYTNAKNISGLSLEFYSKIFLFPEHFNFKSSIALLAKYYFVDALFHEIRHQYQRQKLFEIYSGTRFQEELLGLKYENTWCEIDANEFANIMILKFIKERKMI